MKLNFDKLLTFTASFWSKVGTFAIKWIREDTAKGIFQNEEQNLPYISQQYKKYKQNDMRLLSNTSFNFGSNLNKKGEAKRKGKKEDRLKAYYGKRIASSETRFVNLTLTGDMLRNMAVKDTSNYGVKIAFRSQDYYKIKGNAEYGRVINNLNKNNKAKLTKLIVEKINENIKSQLGRDKWDTNLNI